MAHILLKEHIHFALASRHHHSGGGESGEYGGGGKHHLYGKGKRKGDRGFYTKKGHHHCIAGSAGCVCTDASKCNVGSNKLPGPHFRRGHHHEDNDE
jgi:hypothetical protein